MISSRTPPAKRGETSSRIARSDYGRKWECASIGPMVSRAQRREARSGARCAALRVPAHPPGPPQTLTERTLQQRLDQLKNELGGD